MNDSSYIIEARNWEASHAPLRVINSAHSGTNCPFFANYGSYIEPEVFMNDDSDVSDKIAKRIAYEVLNDFILSETPMSTRLKQRYAHTASGNRISFASTTSLQVMPNKHTTSRKKSTLSNNSTNVKHSNEKTKPSQQQTISRGKTHSRLHNLKPPPKQPKIGGK